MTATYNRSNVLRLAIESLRRSAFTDWEQVIIGDCCTDDTAEVVAAIEDPRVRFVNLEKNFGDQSGPNNFGAEQARGRYVAFLNHDDLFFPDHLATSLEMIERTGADLVFAGLATARFREQAALERGEWGFGLAGATPTGLWEPSVFIPASAWLLRKELMAEVGGWRPAKKCWAESSQDFMFRAWRMRKVMRFKPLLTVLAVQSGRRDAVYARREVFENQFYFDRMVGDPSFRESVLTSIAMGGASRPGAMNHLKGMVHGAIYRPCLALGINPRAVQFMFRHRKRGRFINKLRKERGLEPI